MQQPNWWNPQKYLVQDSSVQSCCRLVATNKDNAGCNVVWVDGRNPLGEHRTSRWKMMALQVKVKPKKDQKDEIQAAQTANV